MTKKGYLKDVLNIGTYYYDDPVNKKNGEFDVAIKTSSGYDIIEVKYLKDKMDAKSCYKEISQISEINEIDINNYGFIAINGFEKDVPKVKYLFNGDHLFFKE